MNLFEELRVRARQEEEPKDDVLRHLLNDNLRVDARDEPDDDE